MLLGGIEVPVVDVVAAVLSRVREEAERVAGVPVDTAVLSCPAGWGNARRRVLSAAAARAGLDVGHVVPEPVAAAGYFVGLRRVRLAVGTSAVVYDFGGGTFDAAVVRRTRAGFEVLAIDGLADAGGADIDAAVVAGLGGALTTRDETLWRRLTVPGTSADRRAAWQLWDDVRTAKEMLSRVPHTVVHVPLLDDDLPLGREELERLATPIVARTVVATRAAVAAAGVPAGALAAVFLVGGASRLPLAATLLHREFGIAPTVVEQPELVVAEGVLGAPPASPASPPPQQSRPRVLAESPPGGSAARRRWRVPVTATVALLVLAAAVEATPRLLSALRDDDSNESTVVSQYVLETGGRTVLDLDFSPDGRLLAVNDGDETVQIWDVASRRQMGNSHPAQVGVISAVAFAGNGRLATAGDKGQVRIWNVADRTESGQPMAIDRTVGSVASNERLLAAAAGDQVRMWDLTTGDETGHLAAEGGNGVLSVEFSADGTAIAAAGFDGLWLWNLAAGRRQVIADHSGPAYSLAFSPDGRTLVTGRHDGGATLWDTGTGRRMAILEDAEATEVPVVDFSADGEHVVTAGFGPVASTFPVRIWEATAPNAVVETLSINFQPRAVRYSPDGRYLAVAGTNVILFELAGDR
ncbi:Hsp70 family protein [Micromonospora sp. CPCC 206061]|uniref:Hsp70 family protein n=1 Tax=Micromonospora sp. CPCC 206061 TaxID=3122410 RepID=UPI002FF1E360